MPGIRGKTERTLSTPETDRQTFVIANPKIRGHVQRSGRLGGQANYYFRNQYQDASLSETVHRSGGEIEGKLNISQNTHAVLWNPMLEVSGGKRMTKGTEYQSIVYGLEFSNTSYVASYLQFLVSISYGMASFAVRPDGPRNDSTVTGRIAATVSLSKSLQWINDVQIISNTSNVELYAYSRNVFSSGLNFSF